MTADRLDEASMAIRVAREFEDGMVVNLGVGIPSLASDFLPPGREIILHSENGVLGFGPIVTVGNNANINLINANVQPIDRAPGMCFMSHDESFALIRGGHIDITVLGGMEVSERGDLANYHLPGKVTGSLGGGQDLAFCAKRVIVVMTHQTKNGGAKIRRELTLPCTAPGAVHLIVTDIAVIGVTAGGLELREVLPGWTPAEVQMLTDATLKVSPSLRPMQLA
jgi:3-oxoacid CoA-transferase subunit B